MSMILTARSKQAHHASLPNAATRNAFCMSSRTTDTLKTFHHQVTKYTRIHQEKLGVTTTKLRGEVIFCSGGSLPNDGKVIEDLRKYE
jgi:hypothetical protein